MKYLVMALQDPDLRIALDYALREIAIARRWAHFDPQGQEVDRRKLGDLAPLEESWGALPFGTENELARHDVPDDIVQKVGNLVDWQSELGLVVRDEYLRAALERAARLLIGLRRKQAQAEVLPDGRREDIEDIELNRYRLGDTAPHNDLWRMYEHWEQIHDR